MEFYCICRAYHVTTGAAETLLATGTSVTITQSAASGLATNETSFASMVAACIMDVSTLKHFKKGETLRISVGGWFKCLEVGAEDFHVMIGHDPANRTTEPGTIGGGINPEVALANEEEGGGTVVYQKTQMSFHVPFRIDI